VLVGLKNFTWPFDLVCLHLKLAGLKKFVWPFDYFGLCTLRKFPLMKNITGLHFVWQHIRKLFVKVILDRRPGSDVSKILRDARFEIIFCVITGNVCNMLCCKD